MTETGRRDGPRETWLPLDDQGRPLARFGPDHILDTAYVRKIAREGLARPEEERAKFWRGRRSFAARKLYEAGLEEDEVVATLVSFHRRVRDEVRVRALLNRVEAAITEPEGGS